MEYILPIFTSFLFCFIAILLVSPIAVKVGLVDVPNARKHHDGHVPLIGGIAIYIGVIASSVFFFEANSSFFVYLFSASLLLFIGVLDDYYDLPVRARIIAQILVACMMIFGTGYHLESLGAIFGSSEIQLGKIGILVTILAVLGAINAFNMVDGIDGLAGSLSLITFMSLGFLLGKAGSNWYLLALLFIASIAAFLMFNLRWPNRSLNKIFMGDSGSMLIGLTVVWLLVIGADDNVKAFEPVTALYLIAIPLMDMVAIMYRRLKKGKSPIKPDREHLHHIFERAGFTRKQSLAAISLASAVIAFIGCFMQLISVPEWIRFCIFIFMFGVYNYTLIHIWKVITWLNRKKHE